MIERPRYLTDAQLLSSYQRTADDEHELPDIRRAASIRLAALRQKLVREAVDPLKEPPDAA